MQNLPPSSFTRRGFLGGAAALTGLAGLAACGGIRPEQGGTPSAGEGGATSGSGAATGEDSATPTATPTPGTPAEMAARAVVPVLCYHQVREFAADDTAYTRDALVMPPAKLTEHLQAAKNAGFTSISPDQYQAHITTGAELPPKPFMLSFDDGKDNQYSNAYRIVKENGMTATIFIMTVIIGGDGWVTKDQIKEMADGGMTIGSHTWDHHRVDEYTQDQVEEQLVKPRELLSEIIGKPVVDFAYPYGAWNAQGAAFVEQAGYRNGFQLQDKALDAANPLYSIRRQLMGATYDGPELVKALESFNAAGQDSSYTG